MLDRIGKYEIRLQLGRGGMGVVYEGFDPSIGRRVAIKTLRTELIEREDLPEFLERFRREAQSAGRLSHPHIVTIYEYGEQENMPYIVMEYIQGHDLGVDLKRGVRFPLEDVVQMMSQLLSALAHAHEAGVVHRDIKPQNVLLLSDGTLKVVDFGIARIEDSDAFTKTGALIGTPAYMSPEQVLGLHVTAKSDIFSVGILFYQLLTGDRPFTGDEYSIKQKILKQDPMPPSELNPTLGAPWDAVIARAMAKKPEARYENARQFLEAIRAAAEAERRAAESERRKRIEAEEHANREAALRSREAALHREQAERQIAGEEARARVAAEAKANETLRRESGAAARAPLEAISPAATAVSSKKFARSRLPLLLGGIVVAGVAAVLLYANRTELERESKKHEADRIAIEIRLKEEADKRVKAEALAREEAVRRARVEADAARRDAEAKAQAEQSAKIRVEEEAKKVAEEKAKALVLKKIEDDRRNAEATRKEAETKALVEAETRRKVEEQAKQIEARRKAEEADKREAEAKARTLAPAPSTSVPAGASGSMQLVTRTSISIATGGTGGVYYPLGSGIAAVLSKHVSGMQATAEVTGGSVANLQLIGTGRPYIGMTLSDASLDALRGQDRFSGRSVPVRTLMVLYPNRMHVVSVDGSGIARISDLKGKRVSTGAQSSATEVMAFRLIEAAGMDRDRDIRREYLGVAESVKALKDRRIDAFFWLGGIPTAAVTDLANSPGARIRLIDHANLVPAMNRRYGGSIYVEDVIARDTYRGMESDNRHATVMNILVAHQQLDDRAAYNIVKAIFDHRSELIRVHTEAENIKLEHQTTAASPVPWHPGAVRYFAEKGIRLN